MPRLRSAVAVVAVLGLGGTTVALADSGRGARESGGHGEAGGDGHHGKRDRPASVVLRNAAGEKVGRVRMRERRRGGVVLIEARVRGLAPGFYGFHVHTTGRCDAPAFTTAGGHLNPTGTTHNAHAGDLPSLLVNADGTATLATATDRFSIADLRDADGGAVMVHSGPDNFANVPPRYGMPDQETLNTGDSGMRVACGVIR